MQAFKKIAYKSIPTTWVALFRKCNKEAYPNLPDREGVKTANK